MAEVVTKIDDWKIFAMASPGGMTWKYAFQRRRRVQRIAKDLCPKRTHHLADSIEGSYDPAPPDHVIMRVSASADYAEYVHQGTLMVAPIRPRTHPYMVLRPWGAHGPRRKFEVRGQRGQPFLSQALYIVMADL